MDLETLIQLLLAGGSTVGGLLGPDGPARARSDQAGGLAQTDAITQFLTTLGLSNFGVGRQGLLNQSNTPLDANQNSVFQELMGLSGQGQAVADRAPGLFAGANQIVDPRTLGPQATEVFDAAQQDIQNRGNTELLSQEVDRLNEFRDANRAALGPGLQAALDTILSGGNTAETTAAGRAFMDTINAGGQTAGTRSMFGSGQGLVDSGGMTDVLRELMGDFQSQAASGGLTPEARSILTPLQAIIESGGQGGAVQQTTDQVISLLQDQVLANSRNAGEAARADALNRGGQAGVTVGSGLQGGGLREFQDDRLTRLSGATLQGVLGQQNARLQNFGTATSGAGDILRNAAQLLASANAGLGRGADATSANLVTGARLMGDAERTAAANLATGTSGFNANTSNINNRLATGFQGFGTLGTLFNNSELGTTDAMLGIDTQRQSRQDAATDALNTLGRQAIDVRGQNQTSAFNELSAIINALTSSGRALGEAGSLATLGRGQQIGSSADLLTAGNSMLTQGLTSLNASRNNLLNPGGAQFAPNRLQTGLTGFGSGFDINELIGKILGGGSESALPDFRSGGTLGGDNPWGGFRTPDFNSNTGSPFGFGNYGLTGAYNTNYGGSPNPFGGDFPWLRGSGLGGEGDGG